MTSSIQVIEKIGAGKFRSYWGKVPDSEIIMDFNPIINEFNLRGNFCLLHWQAKPFGLRRWGVYCRNTDTYNSIDYSDFMKSAILGSLLQIDETKHQTKPTAVICCEGVFHRRKDEKFTIFNPVSGVIAR